MRIENQTVDLPEARKSKVGNISSSFIALEDNLTAQRVYRCMANNSLGVGQICEIEVTGKYNRLYRFYTTRIIQY